MLPIFLARSLNEETVLCAGEVWIFLSYLTKFPGASNPVKTDSGGVGVKASHQHSVSIAALELAGAGCRRSPF